MNASVLMRTKRALFFLAVTLLLLPLLVFFVRSFFYHQRFNLPRVENGVLDLTGYTPASDGVLPMAGTWEFFPGQWIVSEQTSTQSAGHLVPVPLSWSSDPELVLDEKGIGSYRIRITNCMPDARMVVYIPDINASYRIYGNGALIAVQGDMVMTCVNGGSGTLGSPILIGATPPPWGTVELVVELASPHVGGLYKVPVLMEEGAYQLRRDSRNMSVTGAVCVALVAVACIAYLLAMGDRRFSSAGLLMLDLLMFSRGLFQSSTFYTLKRLLGVHDYVLNAALQMALLFFPVGCLLCMRRMLGYAVSKRRLAVISGYELLLVPLVLGAALRGQIRLTLLGCLLGLLPFVLVLAGLYGCIKRGAPYALALTAALTAVLASAVGCTLIDFGVLVIDIALFPPACFMLSMLIQLWIFLRQGIQAQREALEAENLRLRLKQSRSDLMMSQIKPHFLYNTLIAIHTLCTVEPETAAEATLKFASFFRGNMNLIAQQGMVPFEQELVHIRNYADIEQLRHQKRLTMRYEIDPSGFSVPPLSIQPIVENAIRHGACKNIQGGTVVLRTYQTDTHFAVEVTDDGPGFDPAAVDLHAEEPHGLQNITFRLEYCGARLQIDSAPGQGTRVLVLMPKEGRP